MSRAVSARVHRRPSHRLDRVRNSLASSRRRQASPRVSAKTARLAWAGDGDSPGNRARDRIEAPRPVAPVELGAMEKAPGRVFGVAQGPVVLDVRRGRGTASSTAKAVVARRETESNSGAAVRVGASIMMTTGRSSADQVEDGIKDTGAGLEEASRDTGGTGVAGVASNSLGSVVVVVVGGGGGGGGGDTDAGSSDLQPPARADSFLAPHRPSGFAAASGAGTRSHAVMGALSPLVRGRLVSGSDGDRMDASTASSPEWQSGPGPTPRSSSILLLRERKKARSSSISMMTSGFDASTDRLGDDEEAVRARLRQLRRRSLSASVPRSSSTQLAHAKQARRLRKRKLLFGFHMERSLTELPRAIELEVLDETFSITRRIHVRPLGWCGCVGFDLDFFFLFSPGCELDSFFHPSNYSTFFLLLDAGGRT